MIYLGCPTSLICRDAGKPGMLRNGTEPEVIVVQYNTDADTGHVARNLR